MRRCTGFPLTPIGAPELGLLPQRGIELIDGLVVRIIPKAPRHRHAVDKLNEQFVLQSRGRYEVSCDSLSLRLGPHDMPDPDIALARPGDWSRRDPSVEDIALIVEVADSSADRDLSDKLVRYARAGIDAVIAPAEYPDVRIEVAPVVGAS